MKKRASRSGDTSRRNAGRIDRQAGLVNGLAVNVRAEDLHRALAAGTFHRFGRENGDGVSFLPGGTGRHPDADGSARWALGHQNRQGEIPQGVEGRSVAEKIRHADQQFPEKNIQFRRILAKEPQIVFNEIHLIDRHAALNAAADGVLPVMGQVVPVMGAEQSHDFGQPDAGLGGRRRRRRPKAGSVLEIGHQLAGHLAGGRI